MKPGTLEWVTKAENDFAAALQLARRRKHKVPDIVCFLCQQSVEKYLKARLLEAGMAFPRTHDLRMLLQLCGPLEPLWAVYTEIADALSDYAVNFRYPGNSATPAEARDAIKHARALRVEIRTGLGLKCPGAGRPGHLGSPL